MRNPNMEDLHKLLGIKNMSEKQLNKPEESPEISLDVSLFEYMNEDLMEMS